jgi:ribosomal protein S18 acetylase RimI-like enzyme
MALSWSESVENIDWNELSDLYRRAPLGTKNPQDLETAFTNSRYTVFAWDSGKLVGAGRAVADGVDCSCICDVALLPEYQGRGLGRMLVLKLVEFSRGHSKILLYAAPGKEAFYKKLGFSRMKTAMALFKDNDAARAKGLIES